MEVPHTHTIKQEKIDYDAAKPDVMFERMEIKLDPANIEPHLYVPEPTNLKEKCCLTEEVKMIGNNENEYDFDWTNRLIQEIQRRPPIYNNRLPEHSDRQILTLLWHEIGAAMVPSWENLSADEKSKAEKRIQGRWRNLRTCFRRELNKQKHGSSGKRRKYIFFDQLLFLLPIVTDEAENANVDSEDENSQRLDRSQQDSNDSNSNASQSVTQTQQPIKKQVPKRKTETCEQSLLSMLKDRKEEQVPKQKIESYEQSLLSFFKDKMEEPFDEDKSFLLSLVPTFKKLNDTQKLDAKMEFLATLKRLTQSSQPPPTCCQTPVGYPSSRSPTCNCNTENGQAKKNKTARATGSMDPMSPTCED